MSDLDKDPDADEAIIAKLEEALAAAKAGHLQGIICVMFISNGNISIAVQGEQSLVERLGALEIANDGVKMYESQKQHAKALAAMPKGGTA